ncbi:MAG: hypothetical protein ACR2NF_00590 [Pirellulales bacterium]
MTYAIIGDVHSQGSLLSAALSHCKKRGLTPILLGDLFDSRCEIDETLYTRNLAMTAQREMGAIILNSNHQERLVDAISGELEYGKYCEETFRSLTVFATSHVNLTGLSDWLESLPDGFVFWDKDGLEHCCAHAYFPARLRQPGQTEPYTVEATDDETKQKMVWGPYNSNGTRYHWWKHVSENQSFVRVAGHYHILRNEPGAIVLDANAGYEDGLVPLYEVDAKKLVYFGEPNDSIDQDNTEAA